MNRRFNRYAPIAVFFVLAMMLTVMTYCDKSTVSVAEVTKR